MKATFFKVLAFCRIIDSYDQTLSLTNIGLIIILVKLAIVQQTSLVDLGALFLGLLSYQSKKVLTKDVALASLKSINSAVNTVTQLGAEIVEKQKDLNV